MTDNVDIFRIIIPTDVNPKPNKYEEYVAGVLAQKFRSDVVFVARKAYTYTADVQIVATKEYWEIKNIRGNSRYTIEDNLRKAARQAKNVVINLTRSKMAPAQAASRISHYLKHDRDRIKHVILITKLGKVIDFYPPSC